MVISKEQSSAAKESQLEEKVLFSLKSDPFIISLCIAYLPNYFKQFINIKKQPYSWRMILHFKKSI